MTKYEKDEVVIGYVTGIEKYGIFVNLDEYYNGLIHISEISPNFVRNVNDYVNIGETIKMRILSVDEKNHKVKLSIKNLNYKDFIKFTDIYNKNCDADTVLFNEYDQQCLERCLSIIEYVKNNL